MAQALPYPALLVAAVVAGLLSLLVSSVDQRRARGLVAYSLVGWFAYGATRRTVPPVGLMVALAGAGTAVTGCPNPRRGPGRCRPGPRRRSIVG
ncbi:hypothetical protein O7621_12965 [Solwaraspora sp. WMMD937]|uniref:hypothetical protein n=1 Tax=Solwaraspora sp. WMMD937 TaxID=3016090 RepID=UPI00249A5B61|nr:hypothetical protein [Solwaraspora sp. WMMD937]WFE24092.1 hypothetical protein O7621_12965 [Solwaraspora sp. WMMD937]